MRFALFASLAGLLAARAAHADDPRDTFGLAKRPAEPPPSCDDGRTFGCATALDPFDDVSPYALRTHLSARYLLQLPVGDARHDAVAHYALGASRDESGPYFAGATGLENVWTVEGAPAESLRTGNVETRVPLAFVDSLVVVAGGFAARDRTSTGGSIDARLVRGGAAHAITADAWATLPSTDVRRRPSARGAYQARRLTLDAGPDVSAAVVATGPLPRIFGGRAWYAAGIAPAVSATDASWRAATLIDLDDDGVPDGLPGVVALQTAVETDERSLDYHIPVMARGGWERGAHALELTLLGTATGDTAFLANATQQAAGIDRRFWIGDAIASWRGRWRDTRLQARLSWHRSARRESAHDGAAAGIAQRQTAYIPAALLDDDALARACDDTAADDPYPLIPNCPVPFGFFVSGGAGLLTDSVGDRPTATADAAHRIGRHVLRAGGTFEDSRLVQTARFTGGELVRSLFEGHTDRQRFLDGECPPDPAAPCEYADESALTYRTRYTAAYAEDTLQLGPDVRANAGLRWELMWVGPHLHFSRQLSPRLGVAWDVLGGGASRVFTSLGRSFIMLPAGIGPSVIARPRSVRDVEIPGVMDRNVDPGGIFVPADDIAPAAQDEVTAGFEVGRPGTARAAIWAQGRSLRRGYETVIADPATFDIEFDNPGRHDGAAAARRDSFVLALEVATDPTAKTAVRASYLYGRTVGTWAGPVDPRQGAALYAGDDWDADTANYDGRLPTDPGHRAFVEGWRRGQLGSVGLTVATRLTVASGRPRNVLADSDAGLIYLLPRGSAGRGPTVAQANVRIAARWRGTDVTLDVFNVFDRQPATNLDEVYATGSVLPIAGGTEADLVFLKTTSGAAPARRSAFRLPNAFQAPIAATLGIHRAF